MENNNKHNDFSSNEARKARLTAINRQNRAWRAQILTGYEGETEKERLNFARDLQYMAYPMNYTRGTKAKWIL
jgi:hypothetical protein